MSSEHGDHTPAVPASQFGAGIEDAVILPLVLIALAAKYLYRATLSILIHILDYAFPILLQLARFPLFTLRIIGDGLAALLKGVVRYLPVSGTKRDAWREYVSWHWSWLRQKLSYKAFEETLHHAFEGGMAWVFRKCRSLTPRRALLVIVGAVLWLPISFGAATAMHAVLIAKAVSLPAWMQLLHPLATVIAKSKLLVLPVYPAAWPQAKKHPLVQATFRFCRYFAGLHLVQKTAFRYRQTEHAIGEAVDALGRAATRVGLDRWSKALFAGLDGLTTWIGKASRAAMTHAVAGLSKAPVVGPIVASYAAHYDRADDHGTEKFSEKTRGFFQRWSVKFTAEYYEAKEREQAASRLAGAQAGTP